MSAYALAITPVLEPVYDTKIYQLKDYVDNVLTDSQVGMFNFLMGTYAASQAGLNEYDIEYPYNDSNDVIEWLQKMGLKLYNTIIEAGENPIFKYTSPLYYLQTGVDYALGVAQSIRKYSRFEDLMDDIDASTHYFIPIDSELQASINTYVGLQNGFYDWQFDTSSFTSNVNYRVAAESSISNSQRTRYLNYYNSFEETYVNHVRVNYPASNDYTNFVSFSNYYSTYHNIFINTSNNTWYVVDDNGNKFVNNNYRFACVYYYMFGGSAEAHGAENDDICPQFLAYTASYNPSSYSRLIDLVYAIYNMEFSSKLFYEDFITHVYAGDNWALKHEIYNITDLGLVENNVPSYDSVENTMLIDIKGLISDLINEIDLHTVILNNLFNGDGTLNIDPSLIKVSIELPDNILGYVDVPMPVNLNEIDSYTHNDYLTLIKEHATNFGETIGQYVAFWHNSDAELTYTILGSFIIIMIGAFIGKWGHS